MLLTLTRQLPGTAIYLDGLTRAITRLFAAMPEHLPARVQNQLENGTNPFFPPNVRLVESRREREGIIRSPEPAVILASSGMLSQGVSPLYARHVLREPGSAVLIVGYQDAESAGRQLLEGRDELVLNGERVTVSSHIERFYLSAHADRLGIAKHLSGYPSERLVLTHGDGSAREAIFELFRKERHVDRPQVGEWVDLAGETRRMKTAPAPQPAPKRSATRIRRFKTEVVIVREGNRLVLKLPKTFDKTLIPEGRYRLEAQLAAIASFKLVERPERFAEDPQPEHLRATSDEDGTSPVVDTGLESVATVPEQRAPVPDAEPLASYIEGLRALQGAANARARTKIVAHHPELLKALTVLREKEARVLEMTCWQGMTHNEAGAVLELSGSHVGQLCKRALRKLVYACEWRREDGAQTFTVSTSTPTAAQIVQGFIRAVTVEHRLEIAGQHPEVRPPHPFLTKEEDTVLELVFWEGLDYSQAAAWTGFPVNKVARLRHRAVAKLADYVGAGNVFRQNEAGQEVTRTPQTGSSNRGTA